MLTQRTGLWRPLLLGAVAVGVLAPATAAQATPSAAQIGQQIQVQSTQLEKIVEQYNKAGDDLRAAQTAVAALQKQAGTLAAQVDQANAAVNLIAAEAYKGESMSEFSAVVGAADTSAVVDRLVTIAQVTQYENQQMAGILDVKARQDEQLARLNALVQRSQQLHQSLDAQRKKITSDLSKLYALKAKLAAASPPASSSARTSSGAGTPAPYVAGRAGVAVKYAYAALGRPYSWGASGPGSYDCSGLTMAAWHAAGVSLSHNAASQWDQVSHISRSALQPGDLVFYSGLGHVGIYVGGGQIIHAPTFGDVVRLASVDMMTPYGYGRPR